MSVKFCRIDDRLIHGQVVTTWVNVFKIEQVIIINEEVSKDPIQSNVLKMSSPPNIKLHIFSPAKFIEIMKTNPIKRSTMLLFALVEDVETLINNGYEIPKLNVGGMRGNAEREQLTKAVSLTTGEREVFKRLIDKGIDVEIQMVPTENIVKMKEIL